MRAIEKMALDVVQEVSGGIDGLGESSSPMEAGVDSLMAVELRNALQSKLGGFFLRNAALIDYPTVGKMPRYTERELY